MMISKVMIVSLTVLIGMVLPPRVAASCGGLQGDVVFVLDASGSVGSSNFQLMLQFVNDLVDDFDIASDLIRVGVIKYASSVTTEFDLNDYFDKTSMKNRISSIYYTGGGTNTGGAIYTMRTSLFTAASGDRSNVPNVGIVVTDGVSSSYTYTAQEAGYARAAGITLFSIGIGTGVTELNAIATDPDADHVFTVTSFSGLSSIESAFQTKVCVPAVLSPAPSTTAATSASTSAATSAASSTASSTAGSASSIDSSSSGAPTAAIVGGVVGAAAAVGAAVTGVLIYKKLTTTAVSSLLSTTQGNTPSAPQNSSSQPTQPTSEDLPIPGMAEAVPSVHPSSTKWPARLPPLTRI